MIGLITASNHKRSKRVAHDAETTIRQFPHQVSLRFADTSKHFCGGAILSDLWIVSAAQCTQGSKSSPENTFVVVGVTDLTQEGIRYDLDKIINHPNFNWARRLNDISMLKTDRPMLIMETVIYPINLLSFTSNYIMENGIGLSPLNLTGWGSIHVKR